MSEIDPLATLTPEEVGERLGISAETVRSRCRRGLLPGIQMGGSTGWRIPQAALAEWLAEQSRPQGVGQLSARSERSGAARKGAATRARARRRRAA
ncbi:helix-turn-helix domain-containing protein [Actinomyces urogenitalis]|uniref:helix-turn-helix domain-containing protein n=1 Tax=Actinomyces urogenitalis TaxID=103621 RepID=UPI00189815FE|nr:helix-turn-helix domain-containing protein [Actinomyces urogenitalis]